MKCILCVLVILQVFSLNAQTTFQKVYFNDVPTFRTIMTTSLVTADGGIIMVGEKYNTIYSGLFIVKADSSGNVEWEKHYDSLYNFVLPKKIIQTYDSDFVITGLTSVPTNLPSVVNGDAFILRLDDTGKVIFANHYGGVFNESGFSIAEMPNKNLVMVGETLAVPGRMYMVITDSNGIVIKSNLYNYPTLNPDGGFYGILPDNDGGFFVAGIAPTGNVPYDLCLIKMDSTGLFQWGKSYGGIYPEGLIDFVRCSDGGFLLAGTSESYTSNHGLNSGILVRTDSSGNLLWCKHFPNPQITRITSVKETQDHNIIIATSGMQLIKLDDGGNFLWARGYGDSSLPAHSRFVAESTTGYWIAGGLGVFNGPDYYLVKTDDSGNTVCLSTPITPPVMDTLPATHTINLVYAGSQDSFGSFPVYVSNAGRDSTLCFGAINSVQDVSAEDIIKVYPNPGKGSFSVVAPHAGSLTITDMSGRIVAKYMLHGGKNNVLLQAVPAGIYTGIYRPVKNGQPAVVKLVINP